MQRASESCTNRQPQNVPRQVFIWLQVLLTQGHVKIQGTKVFRAGRQLRPYGTTSIPKEFVQARMHSSQAHLKKILTYLICPEEKGCHGHRQTQPITFWMDNNILIHISLAHLCCISGVPPGSDLMKPRASIGMTSLYHPPLLHIPYSCLVQTCYHSCVQTSLLLTQLLWTLTLAQLKQTMHLHRKWPLMQKVTTHTISQLGN